MNENTEKLAMDLANNHIIVKLKEGNFLIDTGTPYTMSFNGDKVTLNGEEYPAFSVPRNFVPYCVDGPSEPYILQAFKEMIEELSGRSIDGIIGNKTLSWTGLTLDFKNKLVSFEVTPLENSIRFEKKYVGLYVPSQEYVPITNEFSFNGHQLDNVLIDTGSFVNYVPMDIVDGLVPDRTVMDMNPNVSHEFESPVYTAPVAFGGKTLNTEICGIQDRDLRDYLSRFGIKGVVSVTDIFKDKIVSLDYKNNRIYFN